jgi:hypothetical protein
MPAELRDYFAGQAIAGVVTKDLSEEEMYLIAVNAFILADRMMAIRNSPKSRPAADTTQSAKGKGGRPA